MPGDEYNGPYAGDEDVRSLGDYVAILKRRKAQLFVPLLVLFGVAVLVAFALPPVYRSSATILIEQQDIPPEMVQSTVTSYANQRIKTIEARVITRSNMSEIIEKYGLYADDLRTKTMEEVLEDMREDIDLELLNAEVVDPRTGRPTEATIAFTLAFDHESPDLAQKVANELTSLFLNENLRERTEAAQETSQFLTQEAERLEKQISDLEAQLAEFKAKNVNRLPELNQLNLQIMERTERELMEIQRQIRSLEERRIYLESELAQINPNTSIMSATGERILGPADRLRALEAEYVSLSAVYGAQHPDIIKMRREIEALRKETGMGPDAEELHAQLTDARAELAAAREQYSPEHPDVKRLERSVAALEAQLQEASTGDAKPTTASVKPDNPAYIQLQAQLNAAEEDLKALRAQESALKAKIAGYETRLVQTPQVEREYRALTRDYENAVAKYQEIKAKQMQARLAEELEKDSKGERFVLIEPPVLPEVPEKPNRLAIVFLGLVLSIGGGLGSVAISERVDGSVYGVRGVRSVLGAPPLAAIPYIQDEREQRADRRRKWNVLLVVIVLIALALTAVHFLYKPLDVLWFMAQRELGL